jgi:hypothetical protein
MEAKEGGSKEGGQGAPSMAHTGFIVCWRYSMTDMYYRDDILCEVCA